MNAQDSCEYDHQSGERIFASEQEFFELGHGEFSYWRFVGDGDSHVGNISYQ